MKFLIILTITILAVTAEPKEQAQQKQYASSGFQKPIEKPASVQGRAHSQTESLNHQKEQQHHEKIEGREFAQSQVEGRDDEMGMGMGMTSQLDRSKKSYGHAKCGKAVVVGCGPIVQKVKCKGHGGHAGAYTEPIPQYAAPQEYETGPFIQYV